MAFYFCVITEFVVVIGDSVCTFEYKNTESAEVCI